MIFQIVKSYGFTSILKLIQKLMGKNWLINQTSTKIKPDQESKQEIKNSIQRALLGHVTPNLRAVGVNLEENTKSVLTFYYDQEPSEDEQELASLADTEFIADFPWNQTDWGVITWPYPKSIPDTHLKIYQRYEKNLNLDLCANEEITSFKENSLSDRGAFLNVLQKALLGHITPNLRAVCYEVKPEKEVTLEFYYDQKPSEEELQLAKLSINRLNSDLPSKECLVVSKIAILPYPERLPRSSKNFSYLRYEPPIV